jgi:uncharacterized protein YjbJ (UPF0337 family)
MEMNKNIVNGRWLEIKGDIQKTWGKLTDDELEETKGEMKSIGGLIQKKYGQTQAAYDEKVKAIFSKFSDKGKPESRVN